MAAASVGPDFAVQSGYELRALGVVFHGSRLGFRIRQNLALGVNHGGARAGRLTFLRRNLLHGLVLRDRC